MSTQSQTQTQAQLGPKPLFIYGTLCAIPLLAWALTGDSENTALVAPLVRRARVKGFLRSSIRFGDRTADYPAVIPKEGSEVDGLLILLATPSQRQKLDDFEGDSYRAVSVSVDILDAHNSPCEVIEADMYLWKGRDDLILNTPWDLDIFIKERLKDWLDLFNDMELVG
jgi:gamma-glutamylcyclotransferase (GGCT)/AIG2-like uncharacterized protein YtfP